MDSKTTYAQGDPDPNCTCACHNGEDGERLKPSEDVPCPHCFDERPDTMDERDEQDYFGAQGAPWRTNEALKRAADYLGAQEVAPGKYAWDISTAFATISSTRYGITTAEQLTEWIAQYPEPNHFSRSLVPFIQLPPWWRPEQRTAYRTYTIGDRSFVTTKVPVTKYGELTERITADLETGTEIQGG